MSKTEKKEDTSNISYKYGSSSGSWAVSLAFSRNNIRESVELAELNAKTNADCAELYGDMLMYGVWDTYQMRYDLIRGKLIQSTDNPILDPYLILPRNPQMAIEYYKMVLDSATVDKNGEKVLERAQAKIEYCRRNGYAGMTKCPADTSISIDNSIKHFLDMNAKSAAPADMESSKTFQALPDFRPKLEDPRKKMFRNMAWYLTLRSLIQIFLISLFTFGLGHLVGFSWESTLKLSLATYGWPLILFMIIAHFYARPKGLPLCSCKDLRKAHETISGDFDAKGQGDDPFEKTSTLVLSMHHGKYFVFWIYSMVSVILSFGGYNFINNYIISLPFDNSRHMVTAALLITMFAPSIFVMFWDKVTPTDKEGNSYFFYSRSNDSMLAIILVLIVLLCSYFFSDNDCIKECDESYKTENVEKLIKNIDGTNSNRNFWRIFGF